MAMSIASIEGKRTLNFIDGAMRPPKSGRYLPSFDPTNGEPWYEAADSDAGDVDEAVAAAKRAFLSPDWRRMTQTQRGKLVAKLADLVGAHAAAIGALETRDNGKLLKEMVAQVSYTPETFRYFAGMADKIQGDTIPINKLDMFNFTLREPIGVVGIIVPWNSPMYLIAGNCAPNLAIGNTVVLKPSEHTSASALAFAELVIEAGFPKGVVNVVTGYGSGAGDALTRHPDIAKIAFTGGTETGKKVAANAASHLAPCNMELGGKSPHIVFDDADLDRAANGIVAGIFAAAGQSCVAGSRVFVHKRAFDEVVHKVIERGRAVRIGHPTDEDTQLGPLALKAQLDKVQRYVGYAVEDGAKCVLGGRQPQNAALARGWYFEPTLFVNVHNDMRLCRDEIFGPVAGVMAFEDEADLMRQANDTVYGLAAGIWTRDIDRAMRFARDVDAGLVWINCYRTAAYTSPSGGFKSSGYGKHNGFEAIREYTRLKNVMIDYSGVTHDPFVMRMKS